MSGEKIEARAYLGLFAFVLAAHGLWYLLSNPPPGFADNDGYMRVLRVEVLWRDGGWFDRSIPRYDPPYGYDVHWTRPLDVLISALALPLVPVLGVKQGIFWGGALSGPVLHGATAAALAWAALPLAGRTAAILAGIAATAQYGLMSYGALDRADHHILFAFLAALGLGFTIRALDRERVDGSAFFAGLAAAGGVWIGVEALVFAGVSFAALGIMWLAGADRADAPRASRFAFGFALGLAVALAIERGPFALDVRYNQISIVHATLGALLALFFLAARWCAGFLPTPTRRVLAALAGGALALGVWVFLFPKALGGPMADYVPEYVAYHLAAYSDLAPGYARERLPVTLGITLLAVPWLAWRLWREPAGRRAWAYVAACVAVYGALTAGWTRWGIYASLFPCLALGDMIARATEWLAARKVAPAWRESARAAVVALPLIGPLAAAYWVNFVLVSPPAAQDKQGERQAPSPAVDRLADALSRPPWSERSRVVLVGIDYAGEILYRTSHQVVGMSHASQNYWRDIENAFGARDDATVREILDRRGVELIAIAPGARQGLSPESRAAGGFYDRLTKQPPAWVRPIELPPDASAFRLFEVLPEGRGR